MHSSSLMLATLSVLVLSAILVSINISYTNTTKNTEEKKENFDAVGYVYNIPPNWFMKQEYDPREWLVRTYPDHIESSCMPYSRASKFGSLANINYLSNASRFWRM